MTPQELKDYQISQEAARVATIIMGKPDRDKIEYGAYIIRSNGGSFTHLEVTAGGATWVNPTTVGMANWGQVVGYVHSHPAEQFVEQFPELKLFPTADNANRGQGDWFAFDDRVQRVGDSLAADYGMSPSQVSLELAQFRQYILGPSGKAGENLYQLHGFDTNDRDGTTLGQRVNLNLATCP